MPEQAVITFVSAVVQLHSADASPAQRAAANAWLVDFSTAAGSPALCAGLLSDPSGAPEPALVLAANLVAEAASRQGVAMVEPLLGLCAAPGLASSAALRRLAAAAAAVAVAARAEPALLAAPAFGTLAAPRQLLFLHAVADAAANSGSGEELALRPSVAAARNAATAAIEHALLPAAGAPPLFELCAALRCLTAWAEAGLGLAELASVHAPLFSALIAALDTRPLARETFLAVSTLRATAETSRNLGEIFC